jgi:glycosyltransferase involved in cell wall biosynthesis
MIRQNGISVIICCYNSAARIGKTLHSVFNQQFSSTVNWEVIVVDNCSTDQTQSVAHAMYEKQGGSIPFKVVKELKPGLSNARKKGFESATYEFVLMVDDDNWLCQNYLETIYYDLKENPTAAMVGGLGVPELEGEKPFWFDEVASCFATGPQSNVGTGPIYEATELYGAGCAIRMSCWSHLEQHGFESLLSDRTGKSLISGGDVEMCFAFRLAGFRLLYDSRISFQHFLPSARVNWKYLKRLFIGFGMSKPRTDIYVACLEGRPMPKEGKLPLWLDRSIHLTKAFLSDIIPITKSYFVNSEGNMELLHRFGRYGHIKALIQLKSTYQDLYTTVYSLQKRLSK